MRGKLRIPSVLLVASVAVLTLAGPAAAIGSFGDDDGNIHEGAIEAIAAAGITKGCNPPANDRFCPDDGVTRGAMAAFLVRALGLSATGTADFSDDDESIFEGDIQRLAAAGITKGCNPPSNTRFCPDDQVTRGQMAAFLRRALSDRFQVGAATKEFVDDDQSVFEADIEWLGATGITKGCNPPDNTRFCPDQPVTRAEMATFLMRGLGLSPIPVTEVGDPDDSDIALVSRFHSYRDADDPFWVRASGYWPRSFYSGVDIDLEPGTDNWQVDEVSDPGVYKGWDLLSPPHHWGADQKGPDADWFQFTLTRPARVGVVWRDGGSLPSWLQSGWQEGPGVTIDGDNARVFLKDFGAGKAALGTVEAPPGDSRQMYVVLLAEADGTPTPAPPVPAGKTYPVPGDACPDWVHGRHVTTGPDGKTYQTWHSQMDPVYWCALGHEHGSDPSMIPGNPEIGYGYIADKVPQVESDPGFKEFIFRDLTDRYWVRFITHANTTTQRRACVDKHTLRVMVYDDGGNELMNIGYKADYGRAVRADNDQPLSPTNCGGSLPAADDERERELNVRGDDHHYETWDSMEDSTVTRNLGFSVFRHGFDVRNPVTQCVDATCNTVVRFSKAIDDRDPVWENGTKRTMDMARWDGAMTFSTSNALGTGEFFTDPYGTKLVSPSAANATRQYVTLQASAASFAPSPGENRVVCKAVDPWTYRYRCQSLGSGEDLGRVPDMQIMFGLDEN